MTRRPKLHGPGEGRGKHHDKYAAQAEEARAEQRSHVSAPKASRPHTVRTPPSLPEEINFRLRRNQNFSKATIEQFTDLQQSLMATGMQHGLDPRAQSFKTLHLAMLGGDWQGRAIRDHANQRDVDTREFHENLFLTVQQRLGNLATKPLIAPVEAIRISRTQSARTIMVAAILGGAAKEELRTVHQAVNDVCGRNLFELTAKPRLPIAFLNSEIDSEHNAVVQEIEGITLEELRFGPIMLPRGYPSLAAR